MVDFEVVDLGPTEHVEAGETAPDFERPLVNDDYWEDVALSELTDDGPVLLVFHPMDGAFPATYMWKAITDRDFDEDATVVGVSVSTPYEHKDLIRKEGLADGDYALYSDPANGVAEAYGVVHELDGMAGVAEARPAVFLLDADRTVEYAWVAEEWPEFPEYDAVEEALEGL